MAPKRVNYFTHQFLREQDFKDEQAYHLEGRRRHNRLFHSWGIVEGLEVVQHGEHEIIISPGLAVDKEGREVVLSLSATRNLSSFTHDSEAYIAISYHEELQDEDHLSSGGIEGYIRVSELAEIHEHRKENIDDDAIILAKVRLGPRGHIEHVDVSSGVRKLAREAASPVSGWLRMCFKPVRLGGVRIQDQLVDSGGAENDFIIDEAHTFCRENGARGSMNIPVPPGAREVTGFRIAAETKGEVKVRLFRAGWNRSENKFERTMLLEETLINGSFHKELEVNSKLDDSHALAVSIRAENHSAIWLLAVKFN